MFAVPAKFKSAWHYALGDRGAIRAGLDGGGGGRAWRARGGRATWANLKILVTSGAASVRMSQSAVGGSAMDAPRLQAPAIGEFLGYLKMVTRAKPPSPTSYSTRQQKDSIRRLTCRASTGTSGRKGST
jgi:hypothetical protein